MYFGAEVKEYQHVKCQIQKLILCSQCRIKLVTSIIRVTKKVCVFEEKCDSQPVRVCALSHCLHNNYIESLCPGLCERNVSRVCECVNMHSHTHTHTYYPKNKEVSLTLVNLFQSSWVLHSLKHPWGQSSNDRLDLKSILHKPIAMYSGLMEG